VSHPTLLTLLLPGALPEGPIAAELAKQLAAASGPAPTLLNWFQEATVETRPFDVDLAACSALESWFFAQAGFTAPHPDLKPGSALASLLAPASSHDSEPVWVAELAHIQVGRDGLVLADSHDLEIDQADSEALLSSVCALFETDGFGVEAIDAGHWRVHPPPGVSPHSATPAVVAGTNLDAWWPRASAARPWRRLTNEVQMIWYEHPVNEAREARGQVAVNGLWLHGGAPAWAPRWNDPVPSRIVADAPWLGMLARRSDMAYSSTTTDPATVKDGDVVVLEDLDAPSRTQGWGDWMEALRRLERNWLAPLAKSLANGHLSAIRLVLTDRQRIVTLHIGRRPALLRWLPRPKKDWKHWWLPPES
jgi:hypothetical protein